MKQVWILEPKITFFAHFNFENWIFAPKINLKTWFMCFCSFFRYKKSKTEKMRQKSTSEFWPFLAWKFKWDIFHDFQTLWYNHQFVYSAYADVISQEKGKRSVTSKILSLSVARRPRMGTEADLSLRGGEVILRGYRCSSTFKEWRHSLSREAWAAVSERPFAKRMRP